MDIYSLSRKFISGSTMDSLFGPSLWTSAQGTSCKTQMLPSHMNPAQQLAQQGMFPGMPHDPPALEAYILCHSMLQCQPSAYFVQYSTNQRVNIIEGVWVTNYRHHSPAREPCPEPSPVKPLLPAFFQKRRKFSTFYASPRSESRRNAYFA